jgi:hypothetical protein
LITGKIRITYAVYRKMALTSYGVRPAIGRALPLLFIAIGLGQWLIGKQPGSTFLPAGVFFLVIPAVYEVLALAGWMLRRKTFAQPFRYEFTATGMTQVTAAGRTDVPWAEVTRVDRWPSTWVVRLGRGRHLAVPRRALEPADRRALNDFFLASPVVFG